MLNVTRTVIKQNAGNWSAGCWTPNVFALFSEVWSRFFDHSIFRPIGFCRAEGPHGVVHPTPPTLLLKPSLNVSVLIKLKIRTLAGDAEPA